MAKTKTPPQPQAEPRKPEIYNAFKTGSTVVDPPHVFGLEADGKVVGEWGDVSFAPSPADLEERLGWMVTQYWGIPLGKVPEFLAAHDPVLRYQSGARGFRWSVKRGLIDGVKEFAVAAVSTNRNSFGLVGMVVVSRDRVTYKVAANDLNKKPTGTRVMVPVKDGKPQFFELGWELGNEPRSKLAPADAVAELFE